MAFLQPDILPAMAEAVHRQLRAARGGRLSLERLVALVTPEGLSSGTTGPRMLRATLAVLRTIGAVVGEDDALALPDDVEGGTEPGGMRRIVREKALHAELDADLWERDANGSLVSTGARDLVRALAWFLNLDVLDGPYDFQRTSPAIVELQRQQTGEELIVNDEQWRPFPRWGRYLGFVSETSLYPGSGSSTPAFVPDPTACLHVHLPDCLDGDAWCSLPALLPALGERLPVLDRGVHRRAVHAKGAPEPAADCSPSLSFALRRLEAAGAIELRSAGDAAKVQLANNQGAYDAIRWSAAR